MKHKKNKRRVQLMALLLCYCLALVLGTDAREEQTGSQALTTSKWPNVTLNVTQQKVTDETEKQRRGYYNVTASNKTLEIHTANEVTSHKDGGQEEILNEGTSNAVSLHINKFIVVHPKPPFNRRHKGEDTRRSIKRMKRSPPPQPGQHVTSQLTDLLIDVAEELKGCALLVVHDEENAPCIEEFLWQDRSNLLAKSLFNLKDITLKNASGHEPVHLKPGVVRLFNSLRHATCTHYLLMVQDKDAVLRILQDLYQARALDLRAKFIIYAKLVEPEQILAFLKDQPLERIVDVLLITENPSAYEGRRMVLSSHAFFSGGDRVALHHLGTWGPNGLNVKGKIVREQRPDVLNGAKKDKLYHFFPEKMEDFGGYKFRVSTFNYPPVVIINPSPPAPGQEPLHDGLEVRIMYTIAQALNIRVHIDKPKDGELWGNVLENGSWSGAMGEVLRGEADVSFANYFITRDRLDIVDMTSLYSIDYACFITPVPDPPPQYTVVVRPFQFAVWVGLVLSMIVMPPALMLTAALETGPRLWFRKIGNCALYVFGAWMTQSQSHELLPRTAHLRVSFTSFSMAAFIITVAYRSALFSFLLVPPASIPVNSLQQLLRSGLQWGVRDRGGWESWFSDSTDPTARKIYEGFQYVNGIDAGIQRVLQGNFAFMNSGRFLRYLVASNFTDKYGRPKLHIAKECFVPFRIGLATPLFSVYTRRFNAVIQRIVEAGLVTKWFDDLVDKAAHLQRIQAQKELASLGASTGDQSGQAVLGLYHLQGLFILLAIGFGVSCLVFVAELVVAVYKNRSDHSSKMATLVTDSQLK